MAKMIVGGYENFQKGLESIGEQRTDGKKSPKLINNEKITNEELMAKLRELKESQIKLLEALPQIVENIIIKQQLHNN